MKSEKLHTTTEKEKQVQVPATMSEKLNWLKCLLRDETLSAKSKNVATALFMCHNERTGQCNPSQAHLAEATGMWRTAVNVALKELLDARWVSRQKTRTTSLYRLEITKTEDTVASEMSGERYIPLSGRPDIPLSGQRYIALSGGPDREPSKEQSKGTIHLNTEPAAMPPAAENDDRPELGEGERFGGLMIPAETWRTWEATFTHLDLRATVLSRSRWALGLPEERRLVALQTELTNINARDRKAALDRKADAEARASAPPAPPPRSRFQIYPEDRVNAAARTPGPNARYTIPRNA
jgi:hypothetical protein